MPPCWRASVTTSGSCFECHRAIAAAIDEERAITPAAEWLVDNFHIVDEQLREIREDLPRGFYRELPKLAERAPRGLPARLRHRLGVRRAHRQPLRAGDPAPLRAGLPARAAADRSASSGRWPSRCASCWSRTSAGSRSRSSRGRAARREADALADALLGLAGRTGRRPQRALRALEKAPLPTSVRRAARPAPARAGSRRSSRRCAGSTSGWPRQGTTRRGDRPRRAPAAGGHERDGPQHHHEHAPDVDVGLEASSSRA